MSPLKIILFVFAFILLIVIIQLNIITVAFDKLGLSSHSAYLLIMATLFGSVINLPLLSLKADDALSQKNTLFNLPQRLFGKPIFKGVTEIKINVGGALLPLVFSGYLVVHHHILWFQLLIAITLVSLVSYWISRPVPGMGIGMPILIAPICAAIISFILNPDDRASLAYVSGTLGVLIGADILRLKDIRHLGAPVASIGGAGSFDGIFITGFVAVLLA
ncbi:MAG: hypothetical protein B7Z60_08440 [Ferrovum sp. 37-45-19]|jgi:uncharacterized membrane protein|nr:MAG: hypothetical protein B7Z65_08630 [Ferrovum sp. 21-44-67]OYV93492.1 MAG: hypothetical protein B7Z60_08440 [Ferrovum sp. 37-45-19]HQT82209.1 DUF1614 domain-containing protein [Ferrovaceae bacterium]HQU07292.1 DUF1614 domain-containing protein [Ferrovaceae bacterium]